MAETGRLGYGSTVRVGRGPTPTWTEFDLVGDLTMPDEAADKIETTHQKSPGRRKQYISGLMDGGEIGIPLNYVPGNATDTLIKAIRATGEEVLIEITLSATGTPEKYAAICLAYERTAPVADKMTAVARFALNEKIEG